MFFFQSVLESIFFMTLHAECTGDSAVDLIYFFTAGSLMETVDILSDDSAQLVGLFQLVQLLVRHPASTFFFRIGGTSMVDAEMDEGDIIIVDRSIEPYNGCSAVCFIDGEFTVKRVERHSDHMLLVAANQKFKPIRITPDNEFSIWGVVTYIIKKA